MTLLGEYAVTHDVFDATSYSHEEVGTARFDHLREVFVQEALLRNLRSGEWLDVFKNQARPWHKRGIELLKKLVKQNRLRPAETALPIVPANDDDWCREALESHKMNPLTGVIATAEVVGNVGPDPILVSIDRLVSAPCWTGRTPSIRLARCRVEYEKQLRLIMSCANSVMFIDPHLDPSLPRYADVLHILFLAKGRRPAPIIEIHRVIYVGSGKSRELIEPGEWENRFRTAWQTALSDAGLRVEIFIWDDHHDRYLITDLIGVAMGNGYDTTSNPNDITTWSRIGRKDRDDIQREFDPACNRHTLRHRFTIP